MNSKLTITIFSIVAVVLSFSFAGYLMFKEINRPKLPILGKIIPFELTDSDGKKFSSHNLRKKVWIVNFFFTTCGDVCPITSKNMAALSRSFDQVDEVSLISITVNPEYDDSEKLKTFSKNYNANSSKWHFLTGEREVIRNILVNGFKLGSIKEPIFHSTYFPLVDHRGNIRGYYDGMKTEEINQLFKDAAALVKDMKVF